MEVNPNRINLVSHTELRFGFDFDYCQSVLNELEESIVAMSALELVESSKLDDILDMPVAIDDADL